jgi:trehalose/maltose transport system permease protein
MSWRRAAGRVGFFALVLAIILYTVFPFYYALLSSMKSGSTLFRVDYLPAAIDFSNYVAVFREQPFGRSIVNSFVVALATVSLSLLLSIMGAYALGRIRFFGRRMLLLTILSASMFPQVAVLSGMFELIRRLGLYDTLPGLALSYLLLTLPFTTWMLTAFMRDLPVELEEAAILDGAGAWTIVMRIFAPLLLPGLVSTGLLAFVLAWNEFLFALTFTLSSSARTVPVAIALISGASQQELPWGNIMAASVIVTLPLIALVLAFQHRIVAGLTTGAVKG